MKVITSAVIISALVSTVSAGVIKMPELFKRQNAQCDWQHVNSGRPPKIDTAGSKEWYTDCDPPKGYKYDNGKCQDHPERNPSGTPVCTFYCERTRRYYYGQEI